MEFTLYKPTKKETGGAIKFNVHKSGKFSFMKAAPQIGPMGGEKVFGWEDDQSINVKMGLNDVGAILSVIFGLKDEAKLFHKTDADNKTITFTHVPDRGGYSLKITHQMTGNADVKSVFVGVSYDESMILKVYFENTVREQLAAAVWSPEEEARDNEYRNRGK
jgi:hypothetical protein